MTPGLTIDASAALVSARSVQATAAQAAADVLDQALVWARLHITADEDLAATWGSASVLLAGAGAPYVTELCVAELAAALGLSTDSGRRLMADVIELAFRLPRVWSRVQAGSLRSWKARRIAAKTVLLSFEAAAHVDAQVSALAHRVSLAELDQLVASAIGQFMPDHAARIAMDAAEGRYVAVQHQQVSFAGTSPIHGELDLADALNLEDALQSGAKRLADLGSEDSLKVRR